jgi:hypothetical protein
VTEYQPLKDEDLKLYVEVMQQIKNRIDAAVQILRPADLTSLPLVELALLQLRTSIELVALSSLISNRYECEKISAAFAGREYADAVKLLRKVNPDYWPRPHEDVVDPDTGMRHHKPIEVGFLTEAEHPRAWGHLSAWLHARSPFEAPPSMSEGVELGRDVAGKLLVLLGIHNVKLINRDQMVVCHMNEGDLGALKVYDFGRSDGRSR